LLQPWKKTVISRWIKLLARTQPVWLIYFRNEIRHGAPKSYNLSVRQLQLISCYWVSWAAATRADKFWNLKKIVCLMVAIYCIFERSVCNKHPTCCCTERRMK
jgi:hypothetical protein